MASSFTMYRYISLLLTKGIHIKDIAENIGISHVYLYAIGEMGRIVLEDSKGSGFVISAFDKAVNSSESLCEAAFDGISVSNPRNIPDDAVPILISPSAHTNEIISELLDIGISRRRIITLNVLLYLGWVIFIKGHTNAYRFSEKNIMIVGANFDNKGSQAMTFVAMQEIKKRIPNCNIWFLPNFWDDIYDREDYRLLVLRDGNNENSTHNEILPSLDAIIDVSGYAVSSIKGFGDTNRVMNYIKSAYDYGILYYLMPQSFGPLDYPGYRLAEMKELLSYVNVIYARENSGAKQLDNLGLKNVTKSLDMVLLSDEVDPNIVYYKSTQIRKNEGDLTGVALVPNKNLCLYHDSGRVVEYYSAIVKHLLENGRQVHIIAHSNDNDLCVCIYEYFSKDDRIKLWIDLRDCLVFSNLITKMDYIIASRYHSIIHAYKKGIPCVTVGWADKYSELLDEFGQNEYMIDIRNGLSLSETLSIIDNMEMNKKQAGETILKTIKTIKKIDIFDVLDII